MSTTNLEYLDEINDLPEQSAADFIKDVKAKVEIFRELQLKFLKAEHLYQEALKEMQHYRDTVLVASMQAAGCYQVEDEQGNFVKLERKYYVSPNKNDADQKTLTDWLKKQKAEFLIKTQAIVEQDSLEELRKTKIPHMEKTNVNTNSLKAFLLNWIGVKGGGIAQGKLEDVPACVHFTCIPEVVTN